MENVFSFMKSNIPIKLVVQDYVALKKAGLYLKGRCPFHDEKNDSFTISPHKNIFYCFGCHKGGDVISFVTEVENCSPIEAVEHLTERYNIELPQKLKAPAQKKDQKENKYKQVCKEFSNWCNQELKKNKEIQSYLEKRKINKKSIDDFSIGLFQEKKIETLIEEMKKSGILLKDLLEANLIIKKRLGLHSPFADRLIFPIKDHLGKVCGFGGRIFKDNDNRVKYYNSQEHKQFNKGRILFGLDLAKKDIKEKKFAFMVEGYTDCIAMFQAGYKNTIASLGTSCTMEQLKILSRYAQKIYVLYDNDVAGQKAIIKIAQSAWKNQIELYVVPLPKNDDPASFLEKNSNLEHVLPKTKEIFDFFIEYLGKNYFSKSLKEKLNSIENIVTTIATINEPIKRNFLLQKSSNTFDIPFNLLAESLKKSTNCSRLNKFSGDNSSEASLEKTRQEISFLDRDIFISLVKHPHVQVTHEELELIEKHCWFQIASLVRKFLKYIGESKAGFVDFLDVLSKEERSLASRLLIESETAKNMPLELHLKRLWKKEWKDFLINLKQEVQEQEVQETGAKNTSKLPQDTIEKFNYLKNKLREKGII